MSQQYQVPLYTATRWVQNWREKTDIIGTDFMACKIPIHDILEIQSIVECEGIRAYNAITDEGEYKVLVVGTDPDGYDIIRTDNELEPYIFDLTLPCPDTCSDGSPLMPLLQK